MRETSFKRPGASRVRWAGLFAFLAGGLFQEPFFDVVEDALRREHHGVEGDGKRDIFRALPDGGLGWEDDEVHGRAV